MSVSDETDLDLAAGAESTAAEEAKGISLLRHAEQRRAESKDALFLDVPSWNGDLIAEYRVVDRTRLETMVRKIQQEAKGNNNTARTQADIDLILEANVGLYAYDAEGGPEEADRRAPIEDDLGLVPYTRVSMVLGKNGMINSARAAVLYLFKDNAVAISAHALTIARWMRDPSKDPLAEEAG